MTAGYGNGQSVSAKARASELLRNPKVLAALRDELTRKLNAGAATGVAVLIELATDPTTPAATRLSAATQLIDRGHGVVASRFAHAHMHAVRSIEDVLAAIDADPGKGTVTPSINPQIVIGAVDDEMPLDADDLDYDPYR